MPNSDDVRWATFQDLLHRNFAVLPPAESLKLLGKLIDLSTEFADAEGLQHAIDIAPDIEARLTGPTSLSRLQYYLGNAWSELQRRRHSPAERAWEWHQPECEHAVIAYRRAMASNGFPKLIPIEQSRILTNLANLFDHLGRFVEAVELWDRALQITPGFGMARGNRGLGLTTYSAHLYDKGQRAIFLKTAHQELTSALDQPIEEPARARFAERRDAIGKLLGAEFLARPHLHEHSLGDSPEEQDYRKRTVSARLFLNPLNDLGPHSIAARDILSTPPIAVRPGEGLSYHGFVNQLKQEFVSARYFHYHGVTPGPLHFADRNVSLTNTLDYPAYGLRTEQLRTAYRLAYSLFDKIAFFLNHYLNLSIPVGDISFRSLWFTGRRKRRRLRPQFQQLDNLPMRGLYWLAKDLAPRDTDLTEALEPEAKELASTRDHLEHKYLKLHTEGPRTREAADMTAIFTDTIAYSMHRAVFEQKCRRILKLSRAALIYLILGIHREERRRAKLAPEGTVRTIKLDTIPDECKQ